MSSLVTCKLGTKKNPYPYKHGQKDRITGCWYKSRSGDTRQWDGKALKDIDYYKKNKEKINGRQKGYYKNNKDKQNEYQKEYREKNKEKLNEYARNYQKKNKEIIKEYKKSIVEKSRGYQKKWRENNREKCRISAANYYKNNKKYYKEYCDNNRDKRNEWQKNRRKERYNNEPIFKLKHIMRVRTREAIISQNARKNERTMEYISCSVAHLYNHIESQFGNSGMNWNNMGLNDDGTRTGWEVDHRRPCASFDLNDEGQKYMCFHWTNLQPMWGKENNEKGADYDPKTFRYKWIDRETGWVGIPKYLMNKLN